MESEGSETSGASDGSLRFKDPPDLALANAASSTPTSLIGRNSSHLGVGVLGPCLPLSVNTHDEKCTISTPCSTPQRRDGHTADTTCSLEGRHSTLSLVDRSGAHVPQHTPLGLAAGAFSASNTVIGTVRQFPNLHDSPVTLGERIKSPAGGSVEIDGTVRVRQTNAPIQATIYRVDDLGGYLP